MAETVSTVSSVSASASAVTLFASTGGENSAARAVFNDSAAVLYIKLGSSASTSSFTVKVPAGGYYELPAPVYDGVVTGIWSSADGAARCTQVDH